jgi:hypothetical protein
MLFAMRSFARSPNARSAAVWGLGLSSALALALGAPRAEAGNCPKPECVTGALVAAGGTIPASADGIVYRATQGKYVSSAPSSGVDDAGDPIPPRYYGPNAEVIDDQGNLVPSSLDDDLADERYKVLKPAGGLRPNRTYKVRFDQQCATGSTQPPPVMAEIKTGEAVPKPTKMGTLEIGEKKVEMRDVPNPEDGGACTVKKEVSRVHVVYKPAPEVLPFVPYLGFRATLDGFESGPLTYEAARPDGTYETDVFVECPTDERAVKAELLVRLAGASVNAPTVAADVTVLPCGGGAAAGDAGADGGAAKAADASGCSCDTTGGGAGGAGLTFAVGAFATGLFVRALGRRKRRS